jgi:hypothetical protein
MAGRLRSRADDAFMHFLHLASETRTTVARRPLLLDASLASSKPYQQKKAHEMHIAAAVRPALAAAPRAVHAHMRLDFGRQPPALGSAAAAALAALLFFAPPSPEASARELASGSGSKVNKDPLSLLRLGLPNQPKAMRDLQAKLEETDDQLSRLLLTNARSALDTAKGTLKGKSKDILKAVPASVAEKGQVRVWAGLGRISCALRSEAVRKQRRWLPRL